MFSALWTQTFPPKPTFTTSSIPRNSGTSKILLITGAKPRHTPRTSKTSLSHRRNHLPSRTLRTRTKAAINDVIASFDTAPENLRDLSTIKGLAAAFAAQERKLDVLWNNASVGGIPDVGPTKQGIEGNVGVNCIPPLLFTQELLPQLQEAVRMTTEAGSVRVLWTGSLTIEQVAPKGGEIDYSALERPTKTPDYGFDYAAAECWGRAYGIVSLFLNPGNVYTSMYSQLKRSWVTRMVLGLMLSEPMMGAYTLLCAGLQMTLGQRWELGGIFSRLGCWQGNGREDIYKGIEEGEAMKFKERCEGIHRPHV
ncbi:hypothetical protein CC80DRAFT_528083 [Byssothecium circinans]|uniref:NAD(P)-binding protein n=1 Tax=Byssothecium circinans TaxID=147558 RepID=A0A6A5TJJ1_9PLEO|nr:hypothetical protein CC80DRAFT_528083 [Byssothecium circinans]